MDQDKPEKKTPANETKKSQPKESAPADDIDDDEPKSEAERLAEAQEAASRDEKSTQVTYGEKTTEDLEDFEDFQKERGGGRKGWVWFWLVVIVAIILIVLITMYRYSNNNEKAVSRETLAPQQTQTMQTQSNNDSQAQYQRLQTEIAALQKMNQQQKAAVAMAESSSQRIANELEGKRSTWLFEEALYLTRLANYTLQFQHNIPTSIVLLNDADSALFRTGNPHVTDARRNIANDIATLEAVPKFDTEGLYLRLAALSKLSIELPLLTESPAVSNKDSKDDAKDDSNKTWKHTLQKNMSKLGKLIVIQRRDKLIEPMLDSTQQAALHHYVLLIFGNAQWAVLYRSPTVFQASLSQIEEVIRAYFAPNSNATKQMLINLADLQKMKLAPKLPDLTDTIASITDLTQQMNPQINTKSTTK